jgi:hypothetical protein
MTDATVYPNFEGAMMKILKKNALDGGNRVILSERGYGFRISILLT